ncbi:MAG: PQQ-dependent sugar dehydrogenase [Pseudomonadota bacterium]
MITRPQSRPALARLAVLALPLIAALTLSGPAEAELRQTETGPVNISPVVTGLDGPWSVGFLPGPAGRWQGELLITEIGGALLYVGPDGQRRPLSGVPRVARSGQGGLLDVLVPSDFARSNEIYLTYARPQRGGSGTALARARLSADRMSLTDVQTIWELEPGSSGGRHFGSRVVEGADGFLYVTIGDRGDRPSAQDLANENGTVVRLARDGSIPPDNPLVGRAGARPEIWTWGHRNPQGMAVDGRGQLWTVEHGARGGDEINRIRRSTNYGWPVISYGRHYSGARIGEGTEREGLAQPAFYWDPSIAPSGMTFVTGGEFGNWRGDALVGSLKFDLISRLDVRGNRMVEVERIETPETARVRDVRMGPDGAVWFLSEGNGTLYRMTPAQQG